MKKNIREYKVNGKQFSYILDSITAEDFNLTLSSDKERVEFFFDTFNKQFNYDYNKKYYKNFQGRIENFLRGLPSCINIEYRNYEIEKIGKSWGYCDTEKKANKFIENWFSVLAFRLIQLANYYNIDLDY